MDPNIAMPQPQKKSGFMKFLPWILVGVMAIAVVVMIVLWRPWESRIPANSRTVEVTGEATVKAEPDEFVFYPTYQFKGADKTALIDQLTKKSDEVVSAVKKLGVEDKNVKSDASGYNNTYYLDPTTNENVYSLSITITVGTKDMAQKVQDYLVTTSPEGAVTPNATFSKDKQKQLESQARDEATIDARKKADQSAKNLGFKVAQVKTVEDAGGFSGGGCGPYGLCAASAQSLEVKAEDTSTSLSVQPGENELSYSVKVVYFIK